MRLQKNFDGGLLKSAAVLLITLLLFQISTSSFAQEENSVEEQKAWEEYEAAAAKAGAGEEVPLPDPVLTAHEAFCSNVKGWCPTVTNGVIAGQKWCLDPKLDCHSYHIDNTYRIYMEYREWLENYCGGFPALLKAGTIRTESEGKAFAKTNSFTEECGLGSVDYAHAKKLNVNACDPESNLLATCYTVNDQLLGLRQKLPGLEQAPLEDQWWLSGASGAIGSNKVVNIVAASGALVKNEDGSLKHSSPYRRALKWLSTAQKKFNFFSWEGKAFLGKNPGKGAFRFARPYAHSQLLAPLYKDGLPWKEPVLPERPDNIMPFPGHYDHCKCQLWPGLEYKRPTKLEDPSWPIVVAP